LPGSLGRGSSVYSIYYPRRSKARPVAE